MVGLDRATGKLSPKTGKGSLPDWLCDGGLYVHELCVTSCPAWTKWMRCSLLLVVVQQAQDWGTCPREVFGSSSCCCEVFCLPGSLSCVSGGSGACQEQAVSWLDHCWATGSAPVETLGTHSDYPRETCWKCLHGAVQHKTCANAAVLLSGL